MPVWILLLCAIIGPFAFPRSVCAEPIFPLEVLSPTTTPAGVHRFRFGLRYAEGERLLFQQTDVHRREFQLPELSVALGFSHNMEVLVRYPFLYLKEEGRGWDYGSGDVRLDWNYRIWQEGSVVPETALHVAVKLPNADNVKDFGTNETDFFIGALFAKRWGRLTLLLNADLGLLGNPRTTEPNQDDVLLYKVGAVYPVSSTVRAGLELTGTAFSHHWNDRRLVRAGFAKTWGKVTVDAGAGTGLNDASGDFEVRAGVSIPFGGRGGF